MAAVVAVTVAVAAAVVVGVTVGPGPVTGRGMTEMMGFRGGGWCVGWSQLRSLTLGDLTSRVAELNALSGGDVTPAALQLHGGPLRASRRVDGYRWEDGKMGGWVDG